MKTMKAITDCIKDTNSDGLLSIKNGCICPTDSIADCCDDISDCETFAKDDRSYSHKVEKIIKDAILDNEYDGLYSTDSECVCHKDDLFPCGEFSGKCSFGYNTVSEDGNKTISGKKKRTTSKDEEYEESIRQEQIDFRYRLDCSDYYNHRGAIVGSGSVHSKGYNHHNKGGNDE